MLQKAYVHILFFLVQWRRLTFCREKCPLLDYYATCRGHSLPTFRDDLSVTSSRGKKCLKSRTVFCRFSCIFFGLPVHLIMTKKSLVITTPKRFRGCTRNDAVKRTGTSTSTSSNHVRFYHWKPRICTVSILLQRP
jgi:hypothetical protein